jgi:hypothetical protein
LKGQGGHEQHQDDDDAWSNQQLLGQAHVCKNFHETPLCRGKSVACMIVHAGNAQAMQQIELANYL